MSKAVGTTLEPTPAMAPLFARLYRRLLLVLAGGVAGIAVVGNLYPTFLRDYPGGFLLVGTGYFVGFALSVRFSLARRGVPGAEFRAYVYTRPLMLILQTLFAIFLLWKLAASYVSP